jgi:hypothetical protein
MISMKESGDKSLAYNDPIRKEMVKRKIWLETKITQLKVDAQRGVHQRQDTAYREMEAVLDEYKSDMARMEEMRKDGMPENVIEEYEKNVLLKLGEKSKGIEKKLGIDLSFKK